MQIFNYWHLLPQRSILKLLLVMKIVTVLLMFFLLHAGASNSYSQRAKVTIRAEQVKLSDILDEVERQTEYLFFYNKKNINVNKQVNVQEEDTPVSEILNKTLDEDVTYHMVNEHIILSKKENRGISNLIQQITITGTVTDQTGKPMPGVNVVFKGTITGVVTDVSGKYSIQLPDKETILIFSFIGCLTEERVVGNQRVIDVVMTESTLEIDEVVVVGYGVQKKINLSGAVSQISAKEMESRSVSSIGQSLQGMVSNLNITNYSGQATSAPTFNVRGYTSITGGGPLILIDNIPASNTDLSRINPDDIESVSVLKDGASAAIYGARASFGVILITTKSGKSEKAKVSFNTYFKTQTIGRQPDVVTDPYEVVMWKHQMALPWYNLYPDEKKEYAKQVSEGRAPAVRANPTDPSSYEYYGSTNWYDEVYEKLAPSYTANFSVSQGRDNFTYYVSGEYYHQDGILKYGTDKYDRYNMRAKGDIKLTNWMTLSNNTAFAFTEYDEPMWGGWDYFHQVNRISSLDIPKNADGTWTSSGADMLGRLQDAGRKTSYGNGFNTTFSLTIEPIKGMLTLKGDANFVRNNNNRDGWDTPITYHSGPEKTGLVGSSPSYAYKENWLTRYNLLNLVADFHHTYAQKHFVQALVGFSQENNYYTYWWAQRKELISITTPEINLAIGDMTMDNSISTYALRGAFFRLNYIFNDRYIIEANGRYDLSSRFPKKDRSGFFPSVSGAWVVSRESFFEPMLNVVSNLKIRASHSSLGNQNVQDYPYIPTMSSNTSGWIIGGERPRYVSQPGLVSASLTWEKVNQTNFGVDLNLIQNKFGAAFDIYNRKTIGMLTSGQPLPGTLGTSVPSENAADLSTKGWELSLDWKDQFQLLRKPFSYSIRFIISNSKSEITKFDNPTKVLSNYYEGQTIGQIWGFHTDGFFVDDADVAANAESHKNIASYIGTRPIEPGDIKFQDRNGDGTISRGRNTLDERGDQLIIGNSTSQYPYSIDLGATWNGFDFRMFLQGIGKRDYFPAAGNHYFWGVYAQPWANLLVSNLDSWTPDNPDGYFPRPKSYVAEQNWVEVTCPNNRYLQNAAYCRLKNLTIGYTLPQNLTQRLKIDRIRVYFSGDNLTEWTKLNKNLDPEGLSDDAKVYPFQRIYSFGLNLNF